MNLRRLASYLRNGFAPRPTAPSFDEQRLYRILRLLAQSDLEMNEQIARLKETLETQQALIARLVAEKKALEESATLLEPLVSLVAENNAQLTAGLTPPPPAA